MTIKVQQVNKRDNGTWAITVFDNKEQVATDDVGNPIYQTYNIVHNPNDGDAILKSKIESAIEKHKLVANEKTSFKTSIDNVLKSISV